MRKEKTKIISSFALVSTVIFIIIGFVYLLTDISVGFADFVNSNISQPFRKLMASIGEIFPFSLFEMLIILLPIILFLVIYRAVKVFSDCTLRLRFLINLLSVILLIYSGHLLALGVAHNTTPIDQKMELSSTEVSEAVLVETLSDLVVEINLLSDNVARNDEGLFIHNYTNSELSLFISDLYKQFADSYGLPKGYYSTVKFVRAGVVMSYLGITGIYTYPTGEANINSSYPDYVTIFTAAHEMAHQRGILRENEANFVAYIILSTSDDPAFRYSAAVNMYSYFASALYKTNKDAYYQIASNLCEDAKVDIRYANAISTKYGDTIIEKISDWINDFYLESSGSGGIVSYSRVVELVLAYRYNKQ